MHELFKVKRGQGFICHLLFVTPELYLITAGFRNNILIKEKCVYVRILARRLTSFNLIINTIRISAIAYAPPPLPTQSVTI